jgi:hypothetical protein
VLLLDLVLLRWSTEVCGGERRSHSMVDLDEGGREGGGGGGGDTTRGEMKVDESRQVRSFWRSGAVPHLDRIFTCGSLSALH